MDWTNCVLWLEKAIGGNKWIDVSKYNNNGVMVGAAFKESSIFFDGIDDYVDCGKDASLDLTEAITIESLVYFTDLSGTQNIVSNNRSTAYGFRFIWDGLDEFRYETHQSGAIQVTKGGFIPVTGSWYHLAVTRSGTDGLIYLNGEDITSVYGNHIDPTLSTRSLKIGTYSYSPSQCFKGSISLVRIYNKALTAQQVKECYEQTYRKV